MSITLTTKQEILDYLLHQGQASAQELAQALAVSPQAIRRHLKDLEEEQLIRYEVQANGVGRPHNHYSLTDIGRDRLRTLPNTTPGRNEFALELLDTLTETLGQSQMEEILHQQWKRKAAIYLQQLGEQPLMERLAGLVKLRQSEGYRAEFFPVDSDHQPPKKFVLTEYNCAIANVAKAFPSICDHELEMFAAALPDCQVTRTHWLVNGEHRCGYLIAWAGLG
ncbi:iron-sulfur cluster biosynthesis transcriptional regulator SufR [Synechococcus sp. PCC 6312]|uniref:iron-sulfur cluster biosynthesis transcriptional regulator SufR n=1 Tax=Synechococcus sp. (strain ATCC 27167 / PCC 6312) TaxID=195253 RepID=UPI00029F2FE0|nr:iron-sulfur cluster biosynthesis transcriptional regulator SufR [Synechococcus sp. PCC 6312]AFY61543.1 iron-sulfur cluster biosynthesis transcriptional regulator SufR [Synechococcus sp. PCC 6312]